MADTETTETAPAASSREGAGSGSAGRAETKGKGKLSALINGPHRDEILIALGFVTVLIAYLTLKKSSGSGGTSSGGTTPSTSTLAPTTGALAGTSGQVAGYSDPTASAGFASYLQNLTQEISQLQAGATSQATTTTPTVTPYAFDMSGAASDAYVRNSDTGEIDQVQAGGQQVWLNPSQWATALSLGAKQPTGYSGGSQFYGKPTGYTPPAATTATT